MFSVRARTSYCVQCSTRLIRKELILSNHHVLKLSKNFTVMDPLTKTCSHAVLNTDIDLKENTLRNKLLERYIRKVLKEYDEFLVRGPNALKLETDITKITKVSDLVKSLKVVKSNIDSLVELKNDSSCDKSFIKSVDDELGPSEKELLRIEEELIAELIPTDEEENHSDIVVEVSGGAGGQEAMLFAKEIHDLYYNYFAFVGWKCELNDYEFTEIGGLRNSSMLVSGLNSFKLLQFEGGVHRVQRIPRTESGGRMHTSTITVAVYPQPSNVDVEINENDVKLETKTARGPGGQNVNKIQTAVRLYHLPTGLIVECQTSRSQAENKKAAYQKLRLKLFQLQNEKMTSTIQSTRKSQIKTKSRNEKVRTYNYSQDRITDHRFRKSVSNIPKYMEGGAYFHDFLRDILELHNEQKRKEFFEKLETIIQR